MNATHRNLETSPGV